MFSFEQALDVINSNRRHVSGRGSPEARARAAVMLDADRDGVGLPTGRLLRRYSRVVPDLRYLRRYTSEGILHALNHLCGGFGVECIGQGGREWSEEPAALYVDVGESYAPTFLYDCATGRITVGTWGDFVEAMERRADESRLQALDANDSAEWAEMEDEEIS